MRESAARLVAVRQSAAATSFGQAFTRSSENRQDVGWSITASLTPSAASQLFDRRCGDQREVARRDGRRLEVGRIGKRRLRVRDKRRRDPREVVGRRAGDDAVEVGGIPLRLHQRLAPAVGAAQEVGVGAVAAVVRAHDRLGDLRGPVHAQVPVVDLPLGVVERPAGLQSVGLVAGVGACRGIAAIDDVHDLVLDAAHEAAAAAHREATVPGVGQQHLEADLRADDAGDLAVRDLDTSFVGCCGRLRFGTGIATSGNRSAPSAAHSVAAFFVTGASSANTGIGTEHREHRHRELKWSFACPFLRPCRPSCHRAVVAS